MTQLVAVLATGRRLKLLRRWWSRRRSFCFAALIFRQWVQHAFSPKAFYKPLVKGPVIWSYDSCNLIAECLYSFHESLKFIRGN